MHDPKTTLETAIPGIIILHCSIENGDLVLWAEKQFEDIPKPQKTKGKPSSNPPPKAHPFCATPENLVNALPELHLTQARFDKSLIWLPSGENAPIPSDPILGPLNEKKVSTLKPWAIWSCKLSLLELLPLLLKQGDKELLRPGVKFGPEFSFYNHLCLFGLSLTIRQRALPSIQRNKNEYESAWKPIFIGQDRERISLLENGMPEICRVLTTSLKQQNCPDLHPKNHIAAVLDKLVDGIMRQKDLEYDSVGSIKKTDIIHDVWLKGLKNTRHRFKTSVDETEKLYHTIQEWQHPLKNALLSPFKFCLRIEEPTEMTKLKKNLTVASSPWSISYFLQAYDDPSLIVPIKDVWNPKGVKRKILERPNFHARQFVLTSLGMATGICPQIEKSLQDTIPIGFSIDPDHTVDFFSNQVSKLEDAGFGVICPNWWKKKLSAKSKITSPTFQNKRKRSIWEDINADWQIYLGDLGLSLDELQQLALLKNPIIKMRGEWVLLNKSDIEKAILFLTKNPFKPNRATDILQIAAGISDKEHGIAIDGVEATGWVSEFLESIQNNRPMEMLEPPKGFCGTLRPYQIRGYSWMSFLQKWELGACLADDMGLGKTPQTLAMIMRRFENTEEKAPTLLICPTSLTGNWSKEAAKFVPSLPVHVHYGINRKKGSSFTKEVANSGLVITSYALLQRDEALFNQIDWEGIILDEAQNIKNSETKQTKSAHKLQAKYKLALTGTPVENNVGDLWSIMHFLNPGYLGSRESFKKNFFNPIQFERDQVLINTLKNLTKPLILRRLKSDKSIISDLPDKIETKVYCTLTPEQVSLYETVVANANNLLETTEGIERKGVILATLGKLKQICNHPLNFLDDGSAFDERSGKVKQLHELLNIIQTANERCLIFSQYSIMGQQLKKNLEQHFGKEVIFLHGGTPKKQRDQMVDRFQTEENGPQIFILSLKAGGVGLNLTKACHVIHFDRWWNPAIENQATDRAFRIGQVNNVHVHKYICRGTIEERIDEMLESKQEIAKNVVGSGEAWITELSTKDLKEMWKLQRKYQ